MPAPAPADVTADVTAGPAKNRRRAHDRGLDRQICCLSRRAYHDQRSDRGPQIQCSLHFNLLVRIVKLKLLLPVEICTEEVCLRQGAGPVLTPFLPTCCISALCASSACPSQGRILDRSRIDVGKKPAFWPGPDAG